MKIEIHLRDLKLTAAQRATVERRLTVILARYGERIDRLKVQLTGAVAGADARFGIVVRMKSRLVRAEQSDPSVFVALEHAARRAARSVARAIAHEGWWDATSTNEPVTARRIAKR